MNKNVFIKLPNYIIKGTKDDVGLVRRVDSKLTLILAYLYLKQDRLGISTTSIENLVKNIGYTIDGKKGRINSKVRDVLDKLLELNLISISTDKFKDKDLIEISLNIFEKNEEENDINFFIVEYDVFKKIVNNNTAEDKNILFNIYSHIRSCMKPDIKVDDLIICGGNLPVAYPSYACISKDTGINEGTLKSYLDKLVELKLIAYKNAGIYSPKNDTKKVYESNNSYITTNIKDYDEKLEMAIKFYKKKKINDGYIFKKNYKIDNKVIGGKMTALNRKIKSGKSSAKDEEKLIRLTNLVNRKLETKEDIIENLFANKKVLSKNYSVKNQKLYKEYKKLELEFKLIDENENLIVEYSLYKKVMRNFIFKNIRPEIEIAEKKIEKVKVLNEENIKIKILIKEIEKIKDDYLLDEAKKLELLDIEADLEEEDIKIKSMKEYNEDELIIIRDLLLDYIKKNNEDIEWSIMNDDDFVVKA